MFKTSLFIHKGELCKIIQGGLNILHKPVITLKQVIFKEPANGYTTNDPLQPQQQQSL